MDKPVSFDFRKLDLRRDAQGRATFDPIATPKLVTPEGLSLHAAQELLSSHIVGDGSKPWAAMMEGYASLAAKDQRAAVMWGEYREGLKAAAHALAHAYGDDIQTERQLALQQSYLSDAWGRIADGIAYFRSHVPNASALPAHDVFMDALPYFYENAIENMDASPWRPRKPTRVGEERRHALAGGDHGEKSPRHSGPESEANPDPLALPDYSPAPAIQPANNFLPNLESIGILALDPGNRRILVQAVRDAIAQLPTLDGKNSWYNQTLEVFANRRLTAAEMRAKFELNRAVEAVGDATVSKDGSPLNMAAVDAAFAKMERHMDYLRVACNEKDAASLPNEKDLAALKFVLRGTITQALSDAAQGILAGTRPPRAQHGGGPGYSPGGRR